MRTSDFYVNGWTTGDGENKVKILFENFNDDSFFILFSSFLSTGDIYFLNWNKWCPMSIFVLESDCLTYSGQRTQPFPLFETCGIGHLNFSGIVMKHNKIGKQYM